MLLGISPELFFSVVCFGRGTLPTTKKGGEKGHYGDLARKGLPQWCLGSSICLFICPISLVEYHY